MIIHCPIPSLIQKPVLLLHLWPWWVGVALTGRWGSLRSLASLKDLQEASSLLLGGPLGLSSWESPVLSFSHSTDLINKPQQGVDGLWGPESSFPARAPS